MPSAKAIIASNRPNRYLVQLSKHAAAMAYAGHTPRMHLPTSVACCNVQVAAEWSDTSGSTTFTPWGRCALIAGSGTLTLRVDATEEDGLAQICDVITRDMQRFSRRELLAVT